MRTMSRPKVSNGRESPRACSASIPPASGMFSAFPTRITPTSNPREAAIMFANELTASGSGASLSKGLDLFSNASLTCSSISNRSSDLFPSTSGPAAAPAAPETTISLDDVPVACFAVSRDVKGIAWNTEMADMSGYRGKDALGRGVTTGFSSSKGTLKDCLKGFMDAPGMQRQKILSGFVLVRADQKTLPVKLRLKLRKLPYTGEVVGCVVAVEKEVRALQRGSAETMDLQSPGAQRAATFAPNGRLDDGGAVTGSVYEAAALGCEERSDYIGLRALVCDPLEANQRLAGVMLERLGYESVFTSGVDEALRRYAAMLDRPGAASAPPFDLVLIDGAAGLGPEVDFTGVVPSAPVLHGVRRFRALEARAGVREVPVVMVASLDRRDLAGSVAGHNSALEAGIGMILRKPVTSRTLKQALYKVVDLYHAPPFHSPRVIGGDEEEEMGGVGSVASEAEWGGRSSDEISEREDRREQSPCGDPASNKAPVLSPTASWGARRGGGRKQAVAAATLAASP